MLATGCRSPEIYSASAPKYQSIQAPAPRNGHVFVIVVGGPVKNKGEHWFPEGSSLATVLDWAGLMAESPPRRVDLVTPDGHSIRCRVAGSLREELEAIAVTHGVRVIVPWDRCYGLSPNQAAAHERRDYATISFERHWRSASEPHCSAN